MNDPREWDRAMMARVRVGDDVALGSVYDRYGDLVYGTAVRLVGADQARDVTQEVFLHLWQHPERYDPDVAGLRGYLAVAARRRAIDALRSRQRREARERRVGRDGRPATAVVETAALSAVVGERVRGAIERLPAEQRRAVELAYLRGLTYRQVAEAMGTAEGTAKSRLRLGLARLATELATEQEPAWN